MKVIQKKREKRTTRNRITHMYQTYVFDLMHPGVVCAYFGIIFVGSMLAMHPLYLSLSFTAAFLLSVYLRGWRVTLKTLMWQLPLVMLISCINPLFASAGSTELFSFAGKVIHAEELIFGGCMGLMLVSVMLWFANMMRVISTDKIMGLFSGKAPILSFMLSAMMRQIPQFLVRGKQIDRNMRACTAAYCTSAPIVLDDTSSQIALSHSCVGLGHSRVLLSQKRRIFNSRVRLISVLMAWSMEDSLELANAMKARGWGSNTQRSSYQRYCLRSRDIYALILLGGFSLANIIVLGSELTTFQFYPVMSSVAVFPGVLLFGSLVSIPLVTVAIDKLRWR